MKFLVLDVETVGMYNTLEITEEEIKKLGYSNKKDIKLVIQLGYLLYDSDFNLIECEKELCKADLNPTPYSMEKNHITPEMIENKKSLETLEIFEKLKKIIVEKDTVVIGHNINFDIEMLFAYNIDLSKLKQIDTLQLSKKFYPENEANRLDFLYYKFSLYNSLKEYLLLIKNEYKKIEKFINNSFLHDSLFDCLVTFQLLLYISKDKSITIEDLIETSNNKIKYETMPYGKKKDTPISELDTSYILYFKKGDIEDKNLDYTLTLEIDKRGGYYKIFEEMSFYYLNKFYKDEIKNEKMKEILEEVFNKRKLIVDFGKYKEQNKNIDQIVEEDKQYIEYLIKNNMLKNEYIVEHLKEKYPEMF